MNYLWLKKLFCSMNFLYSKEYGRYIISLFIQLIIFGSVLSIFTVLFETNDDYGMMSIAAGYMTGNPEPYLQYINIIVGFMLSTLYGILPYIPWYAYFQLCLIILSSFFICKNILYLAYKQKLNIFIGIFAYCLFFAIFLFYPTIMLQFTTTAAIAGATGISFILNMDSEKKKAELSCDVLLASIFLLICFLYRYWAILPVICFATLAMLYIVTKYKRSIFWYMSLCIALSAILILSAYIVNNKAYSTADWEYWKRLNTYRHDVMDFPSPAFKDSPEFFYGLGWDEELESMVRYWFAFDTRINLETFKAVSNYARNEWNGRYKGNVTGNFKAAINIGLNMLLKYKTATVSFSFLTLMVAICIIFLYRKKTFLLHRTILSIGGYLVFGAMFMYLCWTLRFPLRTYNLLAIPAGVCVLNSLILFYEPLDMSNYDNSVSSLKRFIKISFTEGMIYAFFISLSLSSFFGAFSSLERTNIQIGEYKRKLAEHYAVENPDKVLIYGDSLVTYYSTPFTTYGGRKPSNLMFWGGTRAFSPNYIKNLMNHGIDDTDGVFLRDNVYYISMTEPAIIYSDDFILTKYMIKLYPSVKCKLIDTIKDEKQNFNIYIYKYTIK